MSYAKQNIKKYQREEAVELLKVIAYRTAEVITAVGIFLLGYMWFAIL
jgi:hypothetical protein